MIQRPSLQAFTLVEIMIVVAIIGILVATAAAGFIPARRRSRSVACQENLLQIDNAMQTFIMDRRLNEADDLSAYWPDDFIGYDSYIKSLPVCPGDGDYTIRSVGATLPVSCSIVDARYPHELAWSS